ncbi:hypothetical protein [Pseudaminobacter sp. NGMCC 1.201702]|uniref:hypothetical protein n=1 Tax=Pseudaminobacter sp. NGMCC 1.201702 TaxID=3391825 RepID=UPI0039EF2AE3
MSAPNQYDTEAFAAFEEWRAAKIKSDQTMTFADARATALAWVNFQNLYLGGTEKWPVRNQRLPSASIVPFPSGHLGGAT